MAAVFKLDLLYLFLSILNIYRNTLNACFIRRNKVCCENLKLMSLPCTSFLFYFAVSDVTLLLLGFYNFALHHIFNLVYDCLKIVARFLHNFDGILIVIFVLYSCSKYPWFKIKYQIKELKMYEIWFTCYITWKNQI